MKILDRFKAIAVWIKNKFIKYKNYILLLLFIVNIILLFFHLRITVSMTQSQRQELTSTIYNVNNNQNINVNIAYQYFENKKYSFIAEEFSKDKDTATKQINKLNLYQQMFLRIYNGFMYYPTLVDKVDTKLISYSNFSTNYQISEKTNKTIWGFIK